MENSHVRYFLALSEEHNFTRAAQRCGVKQPSLSRAIKVLEKELGGPLFERHKDGVRLTELGADLEPYFAAIDRCVTEIKRPTRSLNDLDKKLADSIALRLGLEPS